MSVCVSIGGPTVFRSDSPSNEILVGTTDGIVFLQKAAPNAEWQESGHVLEGKHVSTLLIEPTRGTIFAGTHGDGIHASDDSGRTWQRRDRGVEFANLYSMNCVETPEGLRLYAGTEPAHLFVSKDLGQSWDELPSLRSVPSVDTWTFPGPPHWAHVKNITFDVRSSDTIYASIEVGGLLKSVDAGSTWRELSGFYEDVHRVFVPPLRPDDLYMATGAGLYHSADAGDTWAVLTDRSARIAYPDAVIVHPERPNLVFTAGAICSPGEWRTRGTADARIGRSSDGGRTWEYLEGGLPEHIRGNVEAMSLNHWPGGFALMAGTTDGDIFCSDDEGESWATIARGLPAVSKGGHYRNIPRGDAPVAVGAR
ncbi:MAG: glycosyl hydrolase [Chloroflexi bacterium]|nr:glycosyl hydrolase [Chloroflexota bacterium]